MAGLGTSKAGDSETVLDEVQGGRLEGLLRYMRHIHPGFANIRRAYVAIQSASEAHCRLINLSMRLSANGRSEG